MQSMSYYKGIRFANFYSFLIYCNLWFDECYEDSYIDKHDKDLITINIYNYVSLPSYTNR